MKKIIIVITSVISILLICMFFPVKKEPITMYPKPVIELTYLGNYYFLDTTACIDCKRAKDLLSKKDADFHEFEVSTEIYDSEEKAVLALIKHTIYVYNAYKAKVNGLVWCILPVIYELEGQYWGKCEGIIVVDLYSLRRK